MFYNEVMSFNETEVTATCCKLDSTPISVTCGRGQSCAASCFSREASLCPSRDCNACDNFEETQQVGRRSLATTDASEWGWCSARGATIAMSKARKRRDVASTQLVKDGAMKLGFDGSLWSRWSALAEALPSSPVSVTRLCIVSRDLMIEACFCKSHSYNK